MISFICLLRLSCYVVVNAFFKTEISSRQFGQTIINGVGILMKIRKTDIHHHRVVWLFRARMFYNILYYQARRKSILRNDILVNI